MRGKNGALWCALTFALFISSAVQAQVAVRGETVYTMAGPPISDGVVLIRDGKIERVGPALSSLVQELLKYERLIVARIGSLEPGKDADFIILSGEPLSVYTKVLETWVEGDKVFDRNDPQDRLYAVGGYGAGHDQPLVFQELLDEGR